MNQPSNYTTRSDISALPEAVAEISKVASRHGVKCWLNYGALLGIVREDRLLPWNNDVELGCFYEKEMEFRFIKVVNELSLLGYCCFYYSSIGSVSIRKGNGVNININSFWDEKSYLVRPHESPSKREYSTMPSRVAYWLAVFLTSYCSIKILNIDNLRVKDYIKLFFIKIFRIIPLKIRIALFNKLIRLSKLLGGKFQKTKIPKNFCNNLIYKDFYKYKMYIPKNPENLLEFIYGKDWKTPKDQWSFYDNKNKSTTSMVFSDEMFDYKISGVI
jgi:phosphorylcholine metabolism protein LicD